MALQNEELRGRAQRVPLLFTRTAADCAPSLLMIFRPQPARARLREQAKCCATETVKAWGRRYHWNCFASLSGEHAQLSLSFSLANQCCDCLVGGDGGDDGGDFPKQRHHEATGNRHRTLMDSSSGRDSPFSFAQVPKPDLA